MRSSAPPFRALAALCAAAALTACAPGGRVAVPPSPAPAGAPVSATAADVAFMRHMIVHHAQALEMAELVPARTRHGGLLLLAERISVSQVDEIAQMRAWLADRGEPAPDEHAHHSGAHADMPGMIRPERMAALRDSSGDAFDRLFLELMIQHHAGAVTMVAALFAAGGAQASDTYHLASEVDADQRMEIERMQRMLAALP